MRLFVSYAHEDETKVEQLVDILREGGHDPWFDDHLMPGRPQIQGSLDQPYSLVENGHGSPMCSVLSTIANIANVVPLTIVRTPE